MSENDEYKPIGFNTSLANKSIEWAKKSQFRIRVGCCIARGRKAVAYGFNKIKTHTKSPDDYKMIHAEFAAAHSLRPEVRGSVAYVCRLRKNGNFGYSRPCKSCALYLKEHGIKYVWFTTSEDWNNHWELMKLDEADPSFREILISNVYDSEED